VNKLIRSVSGFIVVALFGATAVGTCFALLIPAARQLAFGTTSYGARAPDLAPLQQRSTVLWSNGSVMTQLYNEQDRVPVRLRQVPQNLIDAVLAIEDRDFYEHKGVDWRGTLRALVRDIEGEGDLQGGSTITQQLVKITQFPQAERTGRQKIREASVAVQFEQQLTKDQILERYLNEVYFGAGAYGVKAAAERYFNKPLRRISVAEAALIAGLIKNPSGFDPIEHAAAAAARRDQVLDAMVETQRLGRAEAQLARRSRLPERVFHSAKYAPDSYFLAAMIDHLVEQDTPAARALGDDPDTRRARLYGGGLRITTTLDPVLQAHGELAVRNGLPGGIPVTAALVAVENSTGAVRSMVGGIDFRVSKYNLATQGARQPGSSFKPVVLATALEAGYSPNDTILGESRCSFPKPIATTPPDPYVVSAHGGGVMTLRTAIADSINCAFVRLIISLGHGSTGPARVVEMARRLGITRSDLVPVTSLALGTSGVTPLEMATAYSTIAAQGVRHDPEYIQEILDAEGNAIYRSNASGTAVLKPQVARELTQMLTGPVRNGTASGTLGDFARPASGKTGTTDSNVDAWFVGSTAQLTASVWVGQPTCGDNDDPECSLSQYLGDDAFGGRAPARIWRAFMEPALAGQPVVDFVGPDPGLIPTSQYITENGRLARIDLPPPTTTTTSPPTTTTLPATTTTPPSTTGPTSTVPTTTTSTTVPGP
jgi:penicillin-binding protein 1A